MKQELSYLKQVGEVWDGPFKRIVTQIKVGELFQLQNIGRDESMKGISICPHATQTK